MKRNKAHVPIRTCISCGEKRDKKELIRLRLDLHGLLVRDDDKNGQGRGAYVCPRNSCWESLKTNKRLGRAFRRDGPLVFHPDLRFE